MLLLRGKGAVDALDIKGLLRGNVDPTFKDPEAMLKDPEGTNPL